MVVYPIIYRVSYIPGGAGFQPSTVIPVVNLVVLGKGWSYSVKVGFGGFVVLKLLSLGFFLGFNLFCGGLLLNSLHK